MSYFVDFFAALHELASASARTLLIERSISTKPLVGYLRTIRDLITLPP